MTMRRLENDANAGAGAEEIQIFASATIAEVGLPAVDEQAQLVGLDPVFQADAGVADR